MSETQKRVGAVLVSLVVGFMFAATVPASPLAFWVLGLVVVTAYRLVKTYIE